MKVVDLWSKVVSTVENNKVLSLDRNMDAGVQLVFHCHFGNLDVDLTTIILHAHSTALNNNSINCNYTLLILKRSKQRFHLRIHIY